MTKIVTPRTPRTAHPPGSLGADLRRKGYIDYLLVAALIKPLLRHSLRTGRRLPAPGLPSVHHGT
ncbi:hypothetical protein SBV1_3010002 [Verrucomicrobia bacterium]|nr:hypothetical protein SBV1_3010002 [Verrucomicrobiota bacterium]